MYVELHARSAFSFLEGSSLPEELMSACARLNMPAMALLDTDGVYGAPRFHLAAKKLGIKSHIGAEVTANLSPQRHRDTEKSNQQSTINNQQFRNSSVSPCLRGEFRLPLLVSSRTGYQNLCRLITKMKLRAKKGEGAVQKEELEKHAQGLICLTGGADGPLAAALQHGGIEEARKQIEQLIGLFGRGNVYLELQRHFHREEEARNRAAIVIAGSLNLPLARDQWRVLRSRERSRTLRRIHRHPPSPHTIHRGSAAGAQLRASLEIARRSATALCRPARSRY